jgi:hypothetical protein
MSAKSTHTPPPPPPPPPQPTNPAISEPPTAGTTAVETEEGEPAKNEDGFVPGQEVSYEQLMAFANKGGNIGTTVRQATPSPAPVEPPPQPEEE